MNYNHGLNSVTMEQFFGIKLAFLFIQGTYKPYEAWQH